MVFSGLEIMKDACADHQRHSDFEAGSAEIQADTMAAC